MSLNLLVVTTFSKRHICALSAAWLLLASAAAAPALADHQAASPPTQTGFAPPPPNPGPSISGTPHDGQALTANRGTWVPTATLSHRWIRCNADGATGCVFLHADNADTYVLTPADVGKTIVLRVTGSQANPPGSREVDSAPTAVDAAAPAVIAYPGNTGRPIVGATLTGTSARFSYATPPFTEDEYQWERCAPPDFTTCTAIGGAVFLRHILTENDLGSQLRIRERATYGPDAETVDAYSPNSGTVRLPESPKAQAPAPAPRAVPRDRDRRRADLRGRAAVAAPGSRSEWSARDRQLHRPALSHAPGAGQDRREAAGPHPPARAARTLRDQADLPHHQARHDRQVHPPPDTRRRAPRQVRPLPAAGCHPAEPVPAAVTTRPLRDTAAAAAIAVVLVLAGGATAEAQLLAPACNPATIAARPATARR